MSSLSELNLQKQTVAQLTALCREHKLTGYSKLKKAALVEKLEAHRSKQAPVPPAAPANVQPNPVNTVASPLRPDSEVIQDGDPTPATTEPGNFRPQIDPNKSDSHQKTGSKVMQSTKPGRNVSNSRGTTAGDLLLSSDIPKEPLPSANLPSPPVTIPRKFVPQKRPIGHLPDSFEKAPKKRLMSPLTDAVVNTSIKTRVGTGVAIHNAPRAIELAQPLTLPKRSNQPAKRRFVALKPKPLAANSTHAVPSTSASLVASPLAGMFELYSVQKEYDAPLSNITIPPPLSQRKRIKGLSLALRDIRNVDRRTCCFASRTLRYAAYVSAQFILCEEFPGRRTDQLLARAQDCFSNLWPYLTFRRREKARLKKLYEASFLSRYAPRPMAERIWGNPDSGDDVVLALRFTLSRLWFTVSLFGNAGQRFLDESIASLERLAGDEVWKVSVLTKEDTVYTLLVLGTTGEAIGCQQQEQETSRFVRSDWMLYLDLAGGSPRQRLLDNLRGANEEEFVKGISKSWIETMQRQGDESALKRLVAERYVMASVVANSVSGPQMSHIQMAMQTAGVSLEGTRANRTVNLFLSEHHHVESVHFASTSGKEFHPAVASVQTPHREYFILRDNGLQIGCEEEGVSETWMEILGVLRDGSPCL